MGCRLKSQNETKIFINAHSQRNIHCYITQRYFGKIS